MLDANRQEALWQRSVCNKERSWSGFRLRWTHTAFVAFSDGATLMSSNANKITFNLNCDKKHKKKTLEQDHFMVSFTFLYFDTLVAFKFVNLSLSLLKCATPILKKLEPDRGRQSYLKITRTLRWLLGLYKSNWIELFSLFCLFLKECWQI